MAITNPCGSGLARDESNKVPSEHLAPPPIKLYHGRSSADRVHHEVRHRRILRRPRALLAPCLAVRPGCAGGGHEIVRLFFYQDGVYNASGSVVTPQDEQDLPKQWRNFVTERQLDGVVCIAAALRRGVLNAEEATRYQREAAAVDAPWELSGLGQLHDAVQDADRLICFGGA